MNRIIISRKIKLDGEKLNIRTEVKEDGTVDSLNELLEGKQRDLANVQYEVSMLKNKLKELDVEKPDMKDEEIEKIESLLKYLEASELKKKVQERVQNGEKNLARVEEDLAQLYEIKKEVYKQKGEGSAHSKKDN